MKNVQIILDSACDMQKPEADALGVTLLPLRTNFGGEVFLDGVTMTHDEFFEKLTQAKTLPTTSQIPPFDFEEAFRRLHAAGAEILVITLSSKLSGTYQSAVIAAQETGIDVTIVDSENVTAGEARARRSRHPPARPRALARRKLRPNSKKPKSTFASLAGSIRWNIYTAAAGSRKRARSRGHY